MDTLTSESINNADRVVASSTGELHTTERPNEQAEDDSSKSRLPQEILDLTWDAALDRWLKKRVIVIDFNYYYDERQSHANRIFLCDNTLDLEAGELVRNIRLVNRKARNTISLCLRKSGRAMLPPSRGFSRVGLHESFRGHYADFGHDIFWLSRGFLEARFKGLFSPVGNQSAADGPPALPSQPSHMMLSLRHMLGLMEMVFTGNTPCLRSRPRDSGTRTIQDALRGFIRVVKIHENQELRALTVLVPQTMDEWAGKVDYEALEYRPFGISMEETKSALELARTPTNKKQLLSILGLWQFLLITEEKRDLNVLPTLQFACSRS